MKSSTSLSVAFSNSSSGQSYLVLTLALAIFAIAPLLYPGYFQTHSGFVPLWNVADLRANPNLIGWLPHIGLNFDPLRSDGLFPYYLASLLPFAPAEAVKVILGLGWLLGSAGMFLWLKPWLGQPGALVAALVYTYLPAHLATVYVRGAWGEAFFWGWLPWVIWATTELAPHRLTASTERTGRNLLRSLAYSFLLVLLWLMLGLSHLGLTIWAAMLVAFLLLALQTRQALWTILIIFLSPLLTIGIYLSIFAASPFTSSQAEASALHFFDHFLYPFQLFSASWGFDPSRAGWEDGLPFQVGLAGLGLTILSVKLFIESRFPRENGGVGGFLNPAGRRWLFFLSTAVVLILLQFSLTAFLWRLPLLPPGYTLANTLTYPWQLLGLAGLCLAVLAGATLWLDEQLTTLPYLGAIVILVILSSYSYLSPQFIQLDPSVAHGPEAELGQAQIALLTHDFSVVINGNTAGLERGLAPLPLALHGPPQANDILLVNVTWQPLQALTEDLKVFVHLVDANNQLLAQFDGPPAADDQPTSAWAPGELMTASYPILWPATPTPGPYRIFIGLYNETTLTRLSVLSDAEGRVILNVE